MVVVVVMVPATAMMTAALVTFASEVFKKIFQKIHIGFLLYHFFAHG